MKNPEVKTDRHVKHLLSLRDLEPEEILRILDMSQKIKKNPVKFSGSLKNKTLAMFFEKPSLRTRISFETAMTQLGGHAIFLDEGNIHKKESVKDLAVVISRYVDIIMARVYSHEKLEAFANYSTVPVINALSELFHPCQTLADMLTILEHKKRLEGLTLTYIGDGGCNTSNSTLMGCSKLGIDVVIGCPKNPIYNPKKEILSVAQKYAKKNGSKIMIMHNPIKAAENADVIYTDVWVSMGIESETKQRMRNFGMVSPPFQVNNNLLKVAKEDVIVLHCLPAMRGFEITDEVIDGEHSVVYDEAENRLHTQKAVLLLLTKHSHS